MNKKKKSRKTRIEDFLDPWQIKKMQRVAFVKEQLEIQKEVDVNQFLGSISTEYGIRRETLKEYLTDLQDYGVIEISDGKIKWLEKEQSEGEE